MGNIAYALLGVVMMAAIGMSALVMQSSARQNPHDSIRAALMSASSSKADASTATPTFPF